jgi:phosphate ABC transporter phosphate-binding protein
MRRRAKGTSWVRRLTALTWAAAAVLCTVLLSSAPSASATPAGCPYVPISGAGSTWSANAIDAWVTNVSQYCMQIDYAAVGSTSGRQEFGQGTVAFGASEIPYGVLDGTNTDPAPQRGYAYMPDTAGGTTFMYNLKIGTTRVTNLRLSGAAIAGIFTGQITNWDNSIIQNDNPGLTMPNLQIVPVVRSDGSGATAEFTEWMLAMFPSDWDHYCAEVGFSPCTQTSAYPVLPGSAMVGQAGDLGVSGYVSQAQADGAIGYVEYSYALETGFPVALVENQAGYYTEPTAQNVAVSLLQAQIVGCDSDTGACSNPSNNPLYLTQNLSNVYTDPDPRTYELSSYSYMILPTDGAFDFNDAEGETLGAFGSYLLCQGQTQVDALGYSALPINLVEAGFQQLQKIPGNTVPTESSTDIQNCNNPTFSPNGTNLLATDDPQPPACDKAGTTQCEAGTGGATASTPVKSSALGTQSTSSNGASGAKGAAAAAAKASASAGAAATGHHVVVLIPQPAPGAQSAAAVSSLSPGVEDVLKALAGTLLLCLAVVPTVVTQVARRRRQRVNPPGPPGAVP